MKKAPFLSTSLLWLSCLFVLNAQAQTIDLLWTKLQGNSVFDESAYEIQQTTDGGYVYYGTILGANNGDVSGGHGGEDGWLVKLFANGDIDWQRPMGGTTSDEGESVVQTTDGGYIVAGSSISSDEDVTQNWGSRDMWVAKTDNQGTIQWDISLGGSNAEEARQIIQTSDGGYLVVGHSKSTDHHLTVNNGIDDFWIVKLTAVGTIDWQRSYGGSGYDEAIGVTEASNGDYIVTGETYSNDGDVTGYQGNGDVWVLRLQSNGNLIWQKTFGGSQEDGSMSVIETSGNDIMVLGFTDSNDGDVSAYNGGYDMWLLQLDSNGNLIWENCYGGTGFDYGEEIIESNNGFYAITGYTDSSDGDVAINQGSLDAWVIKVSATGLLLGERTVGGSGTDFGVSIAELANGLFVVSGASESNDGDVSGLHGVRDLFIAQLRIPASNGLEEASLAANIWPTPNNGTFSIQLKEFSGVVEARVYSSTGQLIQKLELNSELNEVQINGEPGVYIIELAGDDQQQNYRVVVQ